MSIRIGDRIISGGGGNGESLTNQNLSSEITQVYNWVGTYAEYTEQDIPNTHPDWVCYITDDEFGDEQEYEIIQYTARNVGDIFFTSRTDINLNGAVECNGNTYSLSDYDGEESIKTLLESNRLPYISMSEYDSQLLENDSVGVFGWDGGENTLFRVPTLRDMFLEAGRASELGEYIEAGLPNITGSISGLEGDGLSSSGAIQHTEWYGGEGGGARKWVGLTFDASRSSSVYGNSDTVQPKAIKYRAMIQLSTGVLDESLYKIENHALFDDRITNCITYIPQDIKLELNDETLTLKAGSKVYIPNGFEADGTTRKFDEVVIENDLILPSTAYSGDSSWLLVYDFDAQALSCVRPSYCSSGTTPPSSSVDYQMFYNIDDNEIYWYISGAKYHKHALSLGLFTTTSGTISSIDQVFNGFGYIGSVVFALPGVKGLIPNGRNADGSLKNIKFTTSSVSIIFYNTAYNNYKLALNTNSIGIYVSNPIDRLEYKEKENINYNNHSGVVESRAHVGFVSCDGTKITAFAPKNAFRAVDYNDKEYIAHQAMPSGLYEDLTLGASGTLYVAPADGYVFVDKTATAQGQYLQINFHGMIANQLAIGNGNHVRTWAPVSMGTRFGVSYNVDGTTNCFRFVYAQGAK